MVELLFAADAHVRFDVPLPPQYYDLVALLYAADTPEGLGRTCPMARVVAELLRGKQLLEDALPVCADSNFKAFRMVEGRRGEADLLRFCDEMVAVVDAHWNRARGLISAFTPRVTTASDHRLWKLWPIDAAAAALARLTQVLPK